jgi:subtilisin family serine protease
VEAARLKGASIMKAAFTWLVLGLALVPAPSKAVGSEARTPRVDPVVAERLAASADGTTYVIVMLRPAGGALGARKVAAAAIQDRVLSRLERQDFTVAYRYRTFAALTGRVSATGLDKLAIDGDVFAVGPDGEGHAQLDQSVPFIGADQVHALGVTGADQTVAVLDTGIDTDHPDLADDIAAGGWHFLSQGANQGAGAEDDNGHGTNVSGIITSKGMVSSRGVAPDADMLAV